MMERAEGYDVFVADLLAQAASLSEAEVMSVGWLAAADKAGKFRHTLQMGLVAYAALKT